MEQHGTSKDTPTSLVQTAVLVAAKMMLFRLSSRESGMNELKFRRDGTVLAVSKRRMNEPIEIGTIEATAFGWCARYTAVSGKIFPMSFPRKADAKRWIQQKSDEGLPDLPPLR